MKKPNNNKYFFRILTILIIIFSALYIAMESGYYNSKLHKKVELTEEEIKQFEKDVKDGKDIDVNDYLKEETKDYSNKMSKAGMTLSNGTEKFMTKGISNLFKFLGTLFS